MDDSIRYLKALVLLQVQQMADSGLFGKPELLLSQAGFSNTEIGELLGKNPNAVGMAISRERSARKVRK